MEVKSKRSSSTPWTCFCTRHCRSRTSSTVSIGSYAKGATQLSTSHPRTTRRRRRSRASSPRPRNKSTKSKTSSSISSQLRHAGSMSKTRKMLTLAFSVCQRSTRLIRRYTSRLPARSLRSMGSSSRSWDSARQSLSPTVWLPLSSAKKACSWAISASRRWLKRN